MIKEGVVLITGAGSGIGAGIAKSFAAKGYSLALAGLEPDGDQLARALSREYSIRVRYTKIDLRDPSAADHLASETRRKAGPVSILINNAGIQHVAPIDEFPKSKWNDVIAVNLSAAFHLIQATWQGMVESGFGRIINIASAHGLRASKHKAAYVAAKHGLLGLTKAVAIEGAPHGITCNAICPGFVDTPLVARQVEDQVRSGAASTRDESKQRILAKHAIKEFVDIGEIGAMALLMASREQSHLTGAAIPIDSGWTAQ